MATKKLNVPRDCIGVIMVIQELLDILDENRNFCVICRNKFEAGNVLTIFGCCMLSYHLECASKWLNMPAYGQHDVRPLYVTCRPCTARWDRRTLNAYFPPNRLHERIDSTLNEGDVRLCLAGIPPADSSLVDAATQYGRLGLCVILAETVGHGHVPINREDVLDMIAALMERVRDREGHA